MKLISRGLKDIKAKEIIVTILFMVLLIVCVMQNYRETNYFKKPVKVNNDINENLVNILNLDEDSNIDKTNYFLINNWTDNLIKEISKTDSIENFLKENKICFELSKIDVTTPKFNNEKEKCEYISNKLMIKVMQKYGLGSKILNKDITQKSNIIEIRYSLTFDNPQNDNGFTHEFYTKIIEGKNIIFWNRCRCE